MINLNTYIIEKLKINKDTVVDPSGIEKIYDEFYSQINKWCKYNINDTYHLKKTGIRPNNACYYRLTVPNLYKKDFIALSKKMESYFRSTLNAEYNSIFCTYGPGEDEITILYRNKKINENLNILEKLKINKSTEIDNDYTDTVDKFFKCCGLRNWVWTDLYCAIEKWLKKNSIKELCAYIRSKDYNYYFESDKETIKLFDKVDSSHQANISHEIEHSGDTLYKDKESGFEVIASSKGLIFRDKAQWDGECVFYDKSDPYNDIK